MCQLVCAEAHKELSLSPTSALSKKSAFRPVKHKDQLDTSSFNRRMQTNCHRDRAQTRVGGEILLKVAFNDVEFPGVAKHWNSGRVWRAGTRAVAECL
mmetsp:Transcript_57920/g.154344  ORF Transcript_57920/g.154344 Transcript_57920/m.154344 type:complete len:98 (+) Transcript_57920:172-465(+)